MASKPERPRAWVQVSQSKRQHQMYQEAAARGSKQAAEVSRQGSRHGRSCVPQIDCTQYWQAAEREGGAASQFGLPAWPKMMISPPVPFVVDTCFLILCQRFSLTIELYTPVSFLCVAVFLYATCRSMAKYVVLNLYSHR